MSWGVGVEELIGKQLGVRHFFGKSFYDVVAEWREWMKKDALFGISGFVLNFSHEYLKANYEKFSKILMVFKVFAVNNV